MNNKKRVFSLFLVYMILNSIFLGLVFICVNFTNFIEKNGSYENELSLKRSLIEEEKNTDIYYSDVIKIKDLIGTEGKVYKNYFLKLPTYITVKFFTRRFETDVLLHIYDFEYLGEKNIKSEDKKLGIVMASGASLLLENIVGGNVDYEKIVKFLGGEIYFGKNSFIKGKEVIKKEFNIIGFNDKLSVYSLAVNEKQLKNILPKKFFETKIKLHEINIIFKSKEKLKKYKKLLEKNGYNFKLKNEEFEKTNKKLQTVYYYFFLPVFLVFFILLFMIVELNLENSKLKNNEIIQVLRYLKASTTYITIVFYLEFLLLFIISGVGVVGMIYIIMLGDWGGKAIVLKYFSKELFIVYSVGVYILVVLFSFIKTIKSFSKK